MLILDKAGTDKLLLQLEKQEAFDSRYQFCKVDGWAGTFRNWRNFQVFMKCMIWLLLKDIMR